MSEQLKANAIALALGAVTGTAPTVFRNGHKFSIYWDDKELPKIQSYIEQQLNKEHKQGNITVEYKTAVLPVLIKRYSPVFLFSVASLLFVGYNLKKRVRK